MIHSFDRYIPASALTQRLEKLRAKAASLAHQLEELRREEKILASLLDDAIEPSKAEQAGEVDSDQPAGAGKSERSKGVVEGIMTLIRKRPGLTRDELVDGLKYLNINPFDPKDARRVIMNNLGNQIRNGRVMESNGELRAVDANIQLGS